MARYGMRTLLKASLEEARSQVEAALRAEGFGILTEIDVQKTLKERAGVEMGAYRILGACNPQLAKEALGVDPSLGLLLPCNVVLREVEGGVEVQIQNPEAMFGVVEEETQRRLAPLVQEAKARLERALKALGPQA